MTADPFRIIDDGCEKVRVLFKRALEESRRGDLRSCANLARSCISAYERVAWDFKHIPPLGFMENIMAKLSIATAKKCAEKAKCFVFDAEAIIAAENDGNGRE